MTLNWSHSSAFNTCTNTHTDVHAPTHSSPQLRYAALSPWQLQQYCFPWNPQLHCCTLPLIYLSCSLVLWKYQCIFSVFIFLPGKSCHRFLENTGSQKTTAAITGTHLEVLRIAGITGTVSLLSSHPAILTLIGKMWRRGGKLEEKAIRRLRLTLRWNKAQSLSEANATAVALENPAPARMLSSA